MIPEGQEVSNDVKVVKAGEGVHVQKLTPIIQHLDYVYSPQAPSNLTTQQTKNRDNAVIRISNLMMPQNDYLGYMREDIRRNGDPTSGENDGLPTISEIII